MRIEGDRRRRLRRSRLRTLGWFAAGAAAASVSAAFVGFIALDEGTSPRQPVAVDRDGADGPTGFGTDEVLGGPVVTVEIRTSQNRSLARATVYRDRYLLTAARLVAEADSISVISVTGDAVAASVVGTDPHTDLAVLRVAGRAEGAPRVRRSTLRSGTAVTAVTGSRGSEGAQPATVTATERRERTAEGVDIFGLSRIDLPSRPEMTGAALLDRSGRLVGVLNALELDERSSGDESMVVLPATIAANVADSIIDTGAPRHAWLGVTIADRPPGDMAPCARGVAVSAVRPGSPAEGAQVRPGDLVVSIGGHDTPTVDAVMAKMRTLEPGDATSVRVCSDGTTTSRRIVVIESPVER